MGSVLAKINGGDPNHLLCCDRFRPFQWGAGLVVNGLVFLFTIHIPNGKILQAGVWHIIATKPPVGHPKWWFRLAKTCRVAKKTTSPQQVPLTRLFLIQV